MTCPNCGCETHSGRTTCPECGAKLIVKRGAARRERARETSAYDDLSARESVKPARRRGGASPLPGLIAVILVAALLIGGVALLVHRLMRPSGGGGAGVRPTNTPTPTPSIIDVVTAAPTPTSTPTPAPTPTPEPPAFEFVTAAPDDVAAGQPVSVVRTPEDLAESLLWAFENGEHDLSWTRNDLTEAQFNAVWNAFDVAYISWSNQFRDVKLTFRPGFEAYIAVRDGTLAAQDAEIQSIARAAQDVVSRLISPGMTDFEKEAALHDYIVDHCEYLIDEDYNTQDARGFFQYGLCQCSGYCDTFQLLAKLAGLEVYTLSGEVNGDPIGHSWNLIRLDGLWYALDVTWDDATNDDGTKNPLTHAYFNLPLRYLSDERTWDELACPGGSYATALDDNYYYRATLSEVHTANDAASEAASQIKQTGSAWLFIDVGGMDLGAVANRAADQLNTTIHWQAFEETDFSVMTLSR